MMVVVMMEVVVADGKGEYIVPRGRAVSASTLNLSMDDVIYERPDEYIFPER